MSTRRKSDTQYGEATRVPTLKVSGKFYPRDGEVGRLLREAQYDAGQLNRILNLDDVPMVAANVYLVQLKLAVDALYRQRFPEGKADDEAIVRDAAASEAAKEVESDG